MLAQDAPARSTFSVAGFKRPEVAIQRFFWYIKWLHQRTLALLSLWMGERTGWCHAVGVIARRAGAEDKPTFWRKGYGNCDNEADA